MASKDNNVTPDQQMMDLYQSALEGANVQQDFAKAYMNATDEGKNAFRNKIKEKHLNVASFDSTENMALNMQNYVDNQKLIDSHDKIKFVEVDSSLKADLKSARKKAMTSNDNFQKYMNNELINPETNAINNYSSLGKLYSGFANADASISNEALDATKSMLDGINVNLVNPNNAKDYMKRTYRAKGEKGMEQYINQTASYFNMNNTQKTVFSAHVNNYGSEMRKAGKLEDNIDKVSKRWLTYEGHMDAKHNKMQGYRAKAAKKQEKKALQKAMKDTGASDQTFTSALKGSKGMAFNIGLNSLFAISEYKEGRKEGKTVLGSAADAGVSFLKGELLGMPGMLALGAVKGVGSLAVKGTKFAVQTSRSMNNLQQFTPFADSQFVDTQQLATMRQSGMEMAKMSQYNLQQTLMGTEARNLHR